MSVARSVRLREFAGPTFAPDGQTFFVNIQDAGLPLAVWGRSPRGAPLAGGSWRWPRLRRYSVRGCGASSVRPATGMG